jgi:hypothetical protein
MKKITLLFSMLFVLALSSQLKAQDYKSAIGLRFGSPIAISYKTFLNETNALEFYAGYRGYSGIYSYFNIGGLLEIHSPITDVEGLSWFWGGGLSALILSYDDSFLEDEGSFGLGLSGIVGLDYKFESAPINLSLDIMPTFRFGGWDDGFYAWWALSARYVLN